MDSVAAGGSVGRTEKKKENNVLGSNLGKLTRCVKSDKQAANSITQLHYHSVVAAKEGN